MTTAGIPTLYRGVQYRSRLEAKWAAFFDLLGWRFEYEPFDLDGWIPDFLLVDAKVLVEVKPAMEFPQEVADKIDGAGVGEDCEPMIVGCAVPIPHVRGIEGSDGRPIGWMRANPAFWRPDIGPRWGRAIVQTFSDDSPREHIGLCHEYDDVMRCDRGFDGNRHDFVKFAFDRLDWRAKLTVWGIYTPNRDKIRDLWARAGNATQWRKGDLIRGAMTP